MRQHGRVLAILTFGVAIAVSGLALTRQVIAVAGEADAERLNRAILDYVAYKNPQAPISAFRNFPDVLFAEAQRSKIDHCLALAQAEVESEFRHDAVGSAGEVGLFQILPTTAALFEKQVGPFRRPASASAAAAKPGKRDLGDLADPVTSTKFAMAYLRDIMTRKPAVRDALTEYNGGPGGRHPHYYRMVMGAYVEVLEHADLRCRFREAPKHPPLLTLLSRA
jgi:soluble lytic murein transglycosylase-like protein